MDTCGWFARDAQTFAKVADVLLANDLKPLPYVPRLLWPHDVSAQAETAALPGLEDAAARVQSVFGAATPVAVALESFDAIYWAFRHVQGHEAWQANGALIERHSPPLGPGVAERFDWSRTVTDAQASAARAFRERFRAHLAEVLGTDGVLVFPTMPDVASLRASGELTLEGYRNRAIRLLCMASLSGFRS